MPVPSSAFTVLLLTADPAVQELFKHVFKDAAVTVAQDRASLHKDSPGHPFDAVVMESHDGHDETVTIPSHIDTARTLVMMGSRAVLGRTAKMIQLMIQQNGTLSHDSGRETSLEGYLEMKMGDFVKGMRNGSARNLHPILISAMERPLITSALRETHGNQIQAAELLGLNRNTLRKKIVDLHIPLKRMKAKARRIA